MPHAMTEDQAHEEVADAQCCAPTPRHGTTEREQASAARGRTAPAQRPHDERPEAK